MTDANERDATLAQRIRDALRGVTKGEWVFREHYRRTFSGEERLLGVTLDGSQYYNAICDINDESPADAALIAAAPSLLRAALARIEADAARIAALEEQVVLLEREIGLMSTDFPPEVVDDE